MGAGQRPGAKLPLPHPTAGALGPHGGSHWQDDIPVPQALRFYVHSQVWEAQLMEADCVDLALGRLRRGSRNRDQPAAVRLLMKMPPDRAG